MLPIRHRSIFRSRWIALVWAAGILWTAIDYVGRPPKGADGNASVANGAVADDDGMADVQAAANAIDQAGR